MFTLDDKAFAECEAIRGLCIRGSPTILHKFTLPLMFLHARFRVLWIDFDVFLFKNPIPYVLARAEETQAMVLTSGAFGAECVNSGVVYFGATEKVIEWLLTLLVWMYDHPYEHDQKAVSAFLRAGERVAFPHELPIEPVPWDYLDAEVQFASAKHVPVAGWTGNLTDMVIFHFLNGDSDASVGSHQFAQHFSLGDYRNLMDAFYNRSEADLFDTSRAPWEVVPELESYLNLSRHDARPSHRPPCKGGVVPMKY